MEKDISSLEHTRWRCQYHVVFAPKYRRLAIYGEIRADIGMTLRKLCEQKEIERIEAEQRIFRIIDLLCSQVGKEKEYSCSCPCFVIK